MGVPVFYQGSKYAPQPLVPIPVPPTAPLFLSAEIGAVNASTVVVLFDSDVSASNYATGVTIKVNGTATTITSATRQTNHAIVRYVIPVLWHGSGDSVTWEYASGSGNIVAENGGAALGDVAAQDALNNCEYSSGFDVQADTLALNDGDPVSTWSDQSGLSHDFTQTGTARPTKQTVSSYPAVVLDGSDDYMIGGNWYNNLDSFTIITCQKRTGQGSMILAKTLDGGVGLYAMCGGGSLYSFAVGVINYIYLTLDVGLVPTKRVVTYEMVNRSIGHIYANSSSTGENDQSAPPADDYTNSDNFLIGNQSNLSPSLFFGGEIYAEMFLYPAPNATNRAALEARLAARYGVTL